MGFSDQKFYDYIEYSFPKIGSAGRTGDWRSLRPVIISYKCTKCNLCWLYCPEGSISKGKDSVPVIDLEYCKGCGICAQECAPKSIVMEHEPD